MYEILEFTKNLAINAGKLIIKNLNKIKNIEYKDEFDIVTNIDKHIQNFVISEIKRKYSFHKIISEELENKNSLKENYLWIIDPIDGTVNFSRSFPYFCISIALAIEGELKIGVIYNPYTDELFFAQKGKGAYLNNRQIKVSNVKDFKDSVIATGFPSKDFRYKPEKYIKIFEKISVKCLAVRRCGAAALDFAYLSDSRLDGIWVEGLKIWDIAAGLLLVKEAGGIITDFSGLTLNLLNYKGNVIATNPYIHSEIFKIISEVRK